jgi:hypothetical protein
VSQGAWEAGPKEEFKGMDDFIQHKGIEEFRAILTQSQAIRRRLKRRCLKAQKEAISQI